MARGPAPGWRARKPPVLDAYVLASVDGAGGQYDPATGFYSTLRMRPGPGENITELHRALRRSARYLHKHGIADIGIHVEVKTDRKGRYLEYTAISKVHTYQYMLTRYGPDRSRWPYDPRRRGGELWQFTSARNAA